MQQRYEDQQPVWYEAPPDLFSRNRVTYRARPQAHRRSVSLTQLRTKIIVALIVVLALVMGFLTLSDGAINSVASDEPVVSNKSTARSQWMKGKMPYLYQTDDEWAASSYAGSTVADSGCGPTCMSMVYVYLTGKKDKDPASMAQFSEENDYVDTGMTSWMFMTDGARRLGLTSQELPADKQTIRSHLERGHPIIASVSAGDFTTKGHFIVLESVDGFGRILIRDPNSPERSGQAWDLDRILSQTRNLWVFSL